MMQRRSSVIANEIRLKRSQYQGTFWLVEGRDDRLLCQRFIDTASCKIIVAEGKARVCDVLQILDQDEFVVPNGWGIVFNAKGSAPTRRALKGAAPPSCPFLSPRRSLSSPDTHATSPAARTRKKPERAAVEYYGIENARTFKRSIDGDGHIVRK